MRAILARTMRWIVCSLLAAIIGFALLGSHGPSQTQALAGTAPCPPDDGWTRLSDTGELGSSGQPRSGRAAFPDTLAVDWKHDGWLLTSGQIDLYASATCGAAWVPVRFVPTDGSRAARQVAALAIDPIGRIYVGSGSNIQGLDRVSEDGGQTWRTSPILTNHLAASPSSPGTVYGFANVRANTGFTKFGRTTDGGLTWQVWDARRIDAPPGVAPYVWESKLVVDPRDSETIYCPMFGTILRSVDGGRTFSSFMEIGNSVSALALSIDGARWWVAARDDSLYTSTDSGASWLPVSLPEPLNIEQLVASPHDPRVVFAITDRGAYAYRLPLDEAVPGR